MSRFMTKLNSCLSATNELHYIKSGDAVPSAYKENAPRQKQPNYKISLVKAVASGRSLYLNQEQLSGKGINTNQKIYNPIEEINKLTPAHSVLSKIDSYSKQRVFKKNGIIYDLLD